MIILHKKHILAGTLGTMLLVAGYINYNSETVDVSGNIVDNASETQFVVNMKENLENVDTKNSNVADAYFVSAKHEKEDTYNKQLKYHEEIMYNEKLDEAVKTMAHGEFNNIVDKMSKEMLNDAIANPPSNGSASVFVSNSAFSEASEALAVLGYDKATVMSALKGVDASMSDVGEIIKQALKRLAR